MELGDSYKRAGVGLKATKGTGASQKDQQSQLTVSNTLSLKVSAKLGTFSPTEIRQGSPARRTYSTHQQQLFKYLPLSPPAEPLNKKHTWAGPRPPLMYLVDVQLGLHVGPEQLEQGISQKLLPVCGICSSSWTALSGLSGRGSVWPWRWGGISK